MKTLEDTIKMHLAKLNENEFLKMDDRFGKRLCQFLSEEQMKLFGYELTEEAKAKWEPKPFTRENVLAQLKSDVEFGYEKANNQRGISAELMFYVVMEWCHVLEEGLENYNEKEYAPYGKPIFEAVDEKYGWGICGKE